MGRNILRQRELALAVCVSLGVAACGGGGGGKSSGGGGTVINPPTTPTQPTTPSTPQPPIDVQLTATNVRIAQGAGFNGQGEVIGIIDTGVTRAHPALAGRVTSNLTYVDPSTNNTGVDDVVGHGTAVAEIAAGTPFGLFVGGVAPQATIVSARIINDKAPTDDGSGQGNKTTSADPLGQVNSDVASHGARIINNSWGGVYWDVTDTAATKSFHDAYASLTANGAHLFVFAAGNNGDPNPSDVAALPSRAPDLEQGWLTVVALDSNNTSQIASYSNRCGIAKNYCLAAPGDVIVASADSTAANTTYQIWSGTSLAAPQVSGAAAVVHSAFPSLDYNAVRQIILGTADDLGDPGPDAIYGYGRLNVGRAVRGPGRFDWGNFNANVTGSTMTFSNDIAGTGGLNVTGAGMLSLLGNNSYTGPTTVDGNATLQVMNDLASSLTVGHAGSAKLNATLHGSVTNHGSLTVGGSDPVGLEGAHIDGNLNLASDGTLSLLIGTPFTVGGTATLGGTIAFTGAVPNYMKTSHQQVLSAGSVQGQFAQTVKGPGVFFSSTLQYAATEVFLDTTSLSVTSVANSTMSQSLAATSSAQRVDGAMTQISNILAPGATSAGMVDISMLIAAGGIQQASSTRSAQASLESLSGQLYAAGTAVTLAGIDAGNDALMQHLDAMGKGGAWMQSLDSQGGMSRSGYGNVGFNIGGNMVGNDIRLGANGFAGLAVAQMRSNGQLSGNFDRQRNRSTEGSLYAGTQGANWYSVGRVAFGSYRGDTQRLLRFGDMGGAFTGGDYSGRYNVAYGEMGYRSHLGAFDFTPYADVQYASIHRDGFAELGGDGFGLAADGHTTSRWQAGLGLRAGSTWLTSYGKFRMDMKLGWQNAFATKGEVFSARYTGLSQWAPVDGIGLSRQAATLGLNAGMDLGSRTQLAFGVDQRFASRDHSRSATASVKVAW
ncbi:S8 family serine peptidase [Luteibacter aegosomaticola]|uniref:autotransporter serine protease n=1 Tax=Luteibacter aegosomaticola TaxID=2911538 RepID=UPI001FFB927A|nr:autotransporter serine protease [Luteibacter aegosomaticola]UPG88852.1 S8 family serine peptidase [Luteibacter aegosomaticola]